MFPYYVNYSVVATTNRICVVGNMHGSAMHTIDYSSKQGQIGIGGRFFSIKQCIDHLVSQHGYDRERAQRMCFAVGLTYSLLRRLCVAAVWVSPRLDTRVATLNTIPFQRISQPK